MKEEHSIWKTSMDSQSPPSQGMESISVSPPNGDFSSNSSSKMSAEEKFKIIRSIGEECIQDDELKDLLSKKPEPICYDGFEPSGKMHIAQGVMKVINVNKLVSAGCKVKIWIADWFALMNKKMGGDLDKIQTVGEYLIEIWKAMGLDLQGDKVEFIWSSKEINSRVDEYLPLVINIARRNTIKRITRCCQIMGRNEDDELAASQFFYPCMQCADIFFLKADICQLGMDQRKVNVLAREYCDDIKKKNKPIILSHHMLPGLQKGQEKMSKSNPLSSIFMDDEEAKVNSKIENAHCPLKVVEKNPCLEYIKYIIFPWFKEFTIERGADNDDDILYKNFEDLADDYECGKLLPDVLKPALSKALNKILQPVRDHFRNNPKAKDLLERIEAFAVESHQTGNQASPSQDQESPTISLPNVAMSSNSTAEVIAEDKFKIIKSVGEECIEEEELRKLLSEKPQPIYYDGFEPSGRMHFAEGILKIINVKKLISAGCKIKVLVGDWFALLNNQLGGDLKKIETVGHYMIEIWKAMGLTHRRDNVEFLWSSKEIISRPHDYLPLLLDFATRNKKKRCLEVMGHTDKDEDKVVVSQIFHACMQCADIPFFEVDICQQGKDQREVKLLAREYCDIIKRKDKPIVLSNHMLPGLQGQEKMPKSDPIFMDDEEAEVNLKIKKAVCPPEEVEGNPCLGYIEFIIFPWFNEFRVERRADHGGDITYQSFQELTADYKCGKLHPGDVKPALSKAINAILKPVRDHLKSDPSAKELLKKVKGYKITR